LGHTHTHTSSLNSQSPVTGPPLIKKTVGGQEDWKEERGKGAGEKEKLMCREEEGMGKEKFQGQKTPRQEATQNSDRCDTHTHTHTHTVLQLMTIFINDNLVGILFF